MADATELPLSALRRAVRAIAGPLMRICFRSGVSVNEVRAILESAALHEAERYLAETGRKPTYTKISEITGLARRHIARLMGTQSNTVNKFGLPAGATELLRRWSQDPEYLTTDGRPTALSVHGQGPTFRELALRYAAEIDPTVLVEQLVACGALTVLDFDLNGRPLRVRPAQLSHAGDRNLAEDFNALGAICGDALEAFDASMGAHDDFARTPLQTAAATVLAPKLRLLRRQLRERGETIQASFEEALEPHNLSDDEISELKEIDPAALYSIRVTLLTVIHPSARHEQTIENAWRRPKRRDVAGTT